MSRGSPVSNEPTEYAVIDRIVEEQAVLLVGADEQEVIVPRARVPAGSGEGAWLLVRRRPAGVEIVGTDPEGEARQRERMQRRTERLRLERGGGRFGR